MGLVAADKGSTFKPAPAGTHLAICRQVIDLGHQFSQFYGKVQHKVLIAWELPEEHNEEGKPFMVFQRFTMSLSKNANLRAILEAWRGRAFTSEELKGFNLNNIVGKPCMLNIAHREEDGNTYTDVSTVMALPKGMKAPEPVHPAIVFDIEEFDQAVFDKFSDNLKKTIEASEERKKLREPVAAGAAGVQLPAGPTMGDDEIPF